MGAYSNWVYEQELKEAYDGPLVSAAPGHYRLDERWPDQEPEPILAWRVGSVVVLPVTRGGCSDGECYVLYPDGKARHHGGSAPSEVPGYISLAAWRASIRDELSVADARYIDNIPF